MHGARRSVAARATDLDTSDRMHRPVHGAQQGGSVQGQFARAACECGEVAIETLAPLRFVGQCPKARQHERSDAVGRWSRRILNRFGTRSEEHTSELQSLAYLVCRLLLEKKKNNS